MRKWLWRVYSKEKGLSDDLLPRSLAGWKAEREATDEKFAWQVPGRKKKVSEQVSL